MSPGNCTRPQTPVLEHGVTRANAPGQYRCPHCGETLSGPSELYCYCPELAAEHVTALREAKAA
jgi:hypothetical protein